MRHYGNYGKRKFILFVKMKLESQHVFTFFTGYGGGYGGYGGYDNGYKSYDRDYGYDRSDKYDYGYKGGYESEYQDDYGYKGGYEPEYKEDNGYKSDYEEEYKDDGCAGEVVENMVQKMVGGEKFADHRGGDMGQCSSGRWRKLET